MSVSELFRIAFIEKDRWKLYLQGLGITIEVSIFAAIIGLILGTGTERPRSWAGSQTFILISFEERPRYCSL